VRSQRAPSTVAQPIEPAERARLTLYETNPVTGNEGILYTLFYESYRGYTIYSSQEGAAAFMASGGAYACGGSSFAFLISKTPRP
jgi:hypothetical protein